jgi:L-alanine-DL-glutamate epimerase-like enolase superfamily enzyme
VKTAPGVIDELGLARLSSLSVPVLLDFNCSATGDADVLDQLDQLGDRVTELRVEAVEQPFAAGNVIDHSRLAEQLEVGLSLDEGVRTVRDIEQIVRYGAATLICVKPARVGGYANAKTMILRARELGLEAYLGGFFESPFARAVNRTLAEHVVSVPSDIGVIATLDSVNDSAVRVVDGGFEVAPSSHLLENASLVATFE